MRYALIVLIHLIVLNGPLLANPLLANPTPAEGKSAERKNGIHWFEGSLTQAFETAKQQQKPIFLYWGATWCPPCNQLKATLFQHPAFISKTRLFIPVYLDGDTEQAQLQGEKFNVLGYPTLIVFTPEGEEITRIPGGMDLARYTDILDLSLNHIQPVKQLVNQIMDKQYQPTDREIQLLAFYSWQQDAGQAIKGRDKLELYRKLSQLTPDHMSEENSHFNAEYLLELSKLEQPITLDTTLEALRRLSRIIDNPVNTRSNLEFVVYEMKDVISKLTSDSPSALTHMTDKWQKSLNRLADSDLLSTEQQLDLHRGMVDVYALKKQPLPASLKRQIRYDVETALSDATNDYQRIALTSSGYSLLQASQQNKAAKDLLTHALQQGSNSHYWMLALAGMAKEDKRKQEAIKLYRQAYELATGFATRLQWGSYYMDGLTKLQPQNTQAIEKLSIELIETLKKQPSPFHGRNNKALKRINNMLSEWANSGEQKKIAASFHQQITSLCLQHNDKDKCSALEEASD